MRRLVTFAGGVLGGSVVGSMVGLLFTPASGDEMRGGLRERYHRARMAGQEAAQQKRAELEAKLNAMIEQQK